MSAAAILHHRITAQPNLRRFLGISLGVHAAALIILSLTFSTSIRTSPVPAIQVKLVGVPQPQASAKPVQPPEKVRTQDSAAPKEPPPEMKNIAPSEAKTKLVTEQQPVEKDKPNPVNAQKRPPVLDKTPREKKVVKNDLDAKVVKNPEDFMQALDFVDKLDKPNPTPAKAAAATDKPAGEGPQIQMNLADSSLVSAIQAKINEKWNPNMDTRGLSVRVLVSFAPDGSVTKISISGPSGNDAFDRSLVRAVYMAVPLPIPADKYEKFKELELNFEQ